jgi:sortase A
MKPKGIIYRTGRASSGEVTLEWPAFFRFMASFIKTSGSGIIGFVIITVLFTYGPVLREELTYALSAKETVAQSHSNIQFDNMSFVKAVEAGEVQKKAESFGVNSQFSIVIPEIGAAENVIANVDAGNKKEYMAALQIGVAHAKGTNFPGQGKTIYMFAHSTDSAINIARYNAVFYLLHKLEKGDKVYIFFNDKLFEYQVDHKIITSAKDTSWLNESSDSERLILQTCDPPGTTWKRLLVIAKPVSQ